jgi:ABC-type transport system involved in cytochrome bd biosynthesis fused ATPase/permease subunit
VDAEAEYLIQEALDEVLKGRTALVMAHRLSTIGNADKIMALEGGRIGEVGDHEGSLSRGGLYSQLYRRQIEWDGRERGDRSKFGEGDQETDWVSFKNVGKAVWMSE